MLDRHGRHGASPRPSDTIATPLIGDVQIASLSDDELRSRISEIFAVPAIGEAERSIHFAGCRITMTLRHNPERVCAAGTGGWYQMDTVIDLRFVYTNRDHATVRPVQHQRGEVEYRWDNVFWPYVTEAIEPHRRFSQTWSEASRAVISTDTSLPTPDLARRMDNLRALSAELFPEVSFAALSENVSYCNAGSVLSPLDMTRHFDGVNVMVPSDYGAEFAALIAAYEDRFCEP
jgi:hypothetical protein